MFQEKNPTTFLCLPWAIWLNQCNNHFATIGPKLASNIDPSNSDGYQKYFTGTDKRFQLCPTSVNKVLSFLNHLNKSKAAGLDKISARLIRECADLICIPIRDIFNQSISQGIFPDDWKCERSLHFLNKMIGTIAIIIVQFR